jgi:sulfate transport system substrate-binding protein
MRRIRSILPSLAVLVLAGCGGASDAVAGPAARTPAASAVPSGHGGAHLDLVAYSVVKGAFDKLVPAFQATDAGRGVDIATSYGASGDQSRKVASGLPADVVNFSTAPAVTRLVATGLVDPSWSDVGHQGIVADSVVTIVVRKGNPKAIHDWSDLLAPGVEVVTPNRCPAGRPSGTCSRPTRRQATAARTRRPGWTS